jgi:hypothetical protein
MTTPRPNLDTIRTEYQVPDDDIVSYRPRAFGAINIPFTDGREMTKTEGALLDRLTFDRGIAGLSGFRNIARTALAEATERFPDNPVPSGIPAEAAAAWQGNDGHRDAFRHAYWSALQAKEYGPDWARSFTTAHESVPGNPANREAMDLYNNGIGIQIDDANPRATPEQLATLVEQAVTQGKTVVMDSGGNLEWSDRVRVGQHGLAPEETIAPHKAAPGVVSTRSVAALDTAEPAATRHAALSPQAQTLLANSEHQVRQMAERHGLPWDQGMDNTVVAIARQARADGLTSINQFNVSNGEIRFGQYDGHTLQDGRVDARAAANTPAAVSQEGLVQTDLAMVRQAEQSAPEIAPHQLTMRV